MDTVPQGKPYAGAKCSHGIIRDKRNRAIAYMVLGDIEKEDVIIPADRCIHVFDPLWHDQVRGIPAFAGAIKLIYGSLTATEREQMNQLVRSSISLIEYNDTGGPDMDNPMNRFGAGGGSGGDMQPMIESFAAGMIKYFKSNSGGKLEALDTDTPGDMWDRFQDRVVRTAMAGINWPYELVWKAGEINAALVRNVQERARLSIEDRQDVIKSPAIFTIRYAIAKAMKIGLLPRPKNPADWWKFDFQMPRKFSVDQAKDAKERRENWKLGLISRADIAAEDGRDAEQIEDEKIEEAFRLEKKIRAREALEGITIDRRTIQMLTSNETATAAAEDTEKAPDEDP